MYIIGPVRTAHFGRCRSFPNRFRIRRKAAADLGGGYFFRSTPNLIAAITSISNAMVSAVLMRSPPLRGNNRTVLTGEPHHTRFALLCQFSAPPGRAAFLCPLGPCRRVICRAEIGVGQALVIAPVRPDHPLPGAVHVVGALHRHEGPCRLLALAVERPPESEP